MGREKGKNFYWPFVVGVGYSKINEKDQVKGYLNNGSYEGFHYFIGLQFYWSDRSDFSRRLGASFYLGRNQWNFDNSVLVKTNSGIKYNITEYDFYISLYYYLYK